MVEYQVKKNVKSGHLARIREKCKKPVLQYTKNGQFIKEWDTLTNGGLYNNINQNSIRNCCKGRSKSAGGYVWKYENQ